jgi:hypothetical protein
MELKWFAGGIALVVVLAAAFFFLGQGNNSPAMPAKEVAAIASGHAIYANDVSMEIRRLSISGINASRDDALNVIITRKVLIAEAAKQGIAARGSETEQSFSSFIASKNMTRQQFVELLSQNNLSLDYFMAVLNDELSVKKLVESQVPPKFIIKYDDVYALYNERYNGTDVSFESIEKNLTDELTAIRRSEYKQAYIAEMVSKAEVISFS